MELSEPSSEPRRAAERAAKRATPSSDHIDHVPSGPAELQPRRPHPELHRRAPTTRPPDHVPSGSAELRPPDHVAMMIATKNGAMTTTTTVITGRKARGPDNFIAIDQISIQR